MEQKNQTMEEKEIKLAETLPQGNTEAPSNNKKKKRKEEIDTEQRFVETRNN